MIKRSTKENLIDHLFNSSFHPKIRALAVASSAPSLSPFLTKIRARLTKDAKSLGSTCSACLQKDSASSTWSIARLTSDIALSASRLEVRYSKHYLEDF